MRKIQTQDVFKLARIIKSADLKNEISNAIEQINAGSKKDKNLSEKVGVRVFLTIVEGCADVKTEEQIYELIGGIAEIPASDIKTQSLDATIELIKKIASENNMVNFFSTAGTLL